MKIHCIYGTNYNSNIYGIINKKHTTVESAANLHMKKSFKIISYIILVIV
jgi:hypothetical protein